ncbi:MAG: hypothetical protein WA317_20500 [Mycobacterium sp.]|uniref:hypothetical protein n=1 Tax=Mycobacterium sp. TaxID=1785 RepID=UPI003CC55238
MGNVRHRPDADSGVEEWLDNLEVDPANARDGRHMRRISAAANAVDVAQAELLAAARAAREAGDT